MVILLVVTLSSVCERVLNYKCSVSYTEVRCLTLMIRVGFFALPFFFPKAYLCYLEFNAKTLKHTFYVYI